MKPSNLPISEQLTHCTVRIECQYADGTVGVGTGFFFRLADDGENHIPVIVTNRHVVAGATRGTVHLNRRGADGGLARGKHMSIPIESFEGLWHNHPDNAVDLCVLPIAPIQREAERRGDQVYYVGLHSGVIPSRAELDELAALEDIVMVGYPIGLWDATNNQPIVRRGVTATSPGLDYEGRREFMIDAACFPGSSGSPVFLYNPGSYVKRSGDVMIGSRIMLLGVLYAGPQYSAEGEVKIVDVPTVQRPIAVSEIPSNLGLVIRSELLREFNAVFPQANPGPSV